MEDQKGAKAQGGGGEGCSQEEGPGERPFDSAFPGVGLVTGRTALVTGAGSGIGRAACEVLAREGARILALDRNGDAARRTLDTLKGVADGGAGAGGHRAVQVDVRDEAAVVEAVASVPDLSIAVNCAGLSSERLVLDMDKDSLQEPLEVNLRGTLHVMRAAGRVMLNGAGGSIVNVSSMLASSGFPGLSHYAASKAAVEALSKSAALEWGRQGVRCNVVQPGLIDTPLAHTYRSHIWNGYQAKNALGRPGKPHEVAEVIAFLASDRSSYMNGAVIELTGGLI